MNGFGDGMGQSSEREWEAACDRARGASIGASIMGGFGGVWLCWGLLLSGARPAVSVGVAVAGAVAAMAMGARLRRRLPRVRREETPEERRTDRQFHLVNAGQWVVIFVVLTLLRRAHMAEWSAVAIAAVVGAHFLPLARIFGSERHLWTGVAMLAWTGTSAALLPAPVRDASVCVGAAVVLWASAWLALREGFRLTGLGLAVRAGAPVAHAVRLAPFGRSR